jgi:hypothetical protein
VSKSRIKRLRGVTRPQFRLRVDGQHGSVGRRNAFALVACVRTSRSAVARERDAKTREGDFSAK